MTVTLVAQKTTDLMLFIIRFIESGNKLIQEKQILLEELKKTFDNDECIMNILSKITDDNFYQFKFEIKDYDQDSISKLKNFKYGFSMN